MSITIILAVAAMGTAILLGVGAVVLRPAPHRARASVNLRRGLADAEIAGPVTTAPFTAQLGRRLTPPALMRMLERQLGRAGRPAGWTVDRVMSLKIIATAATVVLMLLVVLNHLTALMLIVAVLLIATAWFLPEILLYSRGMERANKIALALPDTLDQMTIAVEAGLGFDAAMERAGRNGRGPLADELVRTLTDIRLGQPRRTAYLALAERVREPGLSRFVRAIVQGDKHGISIVDVLRAQAGEMRITRRQRAEEKAMKIPVKVIFPLMLCILPVLFIVLLGPTAFNIMQAFS